MSGNSLLNKRSKVFYTYLWLRSDGTPYYVGKGHGRRAIRKGSPKDLDCILIQEYPSEADAFSAEILLIAYYGRKTNGTGILRNRTDGGEGCAGQQFSDSAKEKMSLAKKGKPWSEERRAIKLQPRSAESKQKTSIALLGRTLSASHREKLALSKLGRQNPQYGKPKTAEWLLATSNANKGNVYAKGHKHTEEWKQAASAARLGKTLNRAKLGYALGCRASMAGQLLVTRYDGPATLVIGSIQ